MVMVDTSVRRLLADTSNSTGLECLSFVARQHGVHLTIPQLIHDNHLDGGEISLRQVADCAGKAGLKAKIVNLTWNDLKQIKKTRPVIVNLRDGSNMVLLQIDVQNPEAKAILYDPNAGPNAPLIIDRVRFESIWTGDVALIKRDYGISDEEQPFSIGLIAALIFRERRIVRDVAIAAFVLGILALAPIVFWRLLSDRVLFYKAYNTFYVLCIAMIVVIVFETIFYHLRQYLVHHLTARLDVKLSTYVFERILNLPIDFFERVPIGLVSRDMREIFRIRGFLVGQLFGTVLDSALLLFFIPVMFFFNSTMTLVVLGIAGLIVVWLLLMLPVYRKKSSAVIAAEGEQSAFLVQTLSGIRTIKSLALDVSQKRQWDVHVARVARARISEGLVGNAIHAVVMPLERFAISGSYAIGIYMALSSNDPIYIGALFAFLLLSQRVIGPLMQMSQLINQYDEVRTAVVIVGNLVNRLPEDGRNGTGVLSPIRGNIEFSNVVFSYKGTVTPALDRVSFDVPVGRTLGVMGKSGSGKTTITRLLQRLHSEYGGLIKIDGIDVREYDVDHLRRNIGVVLQESFLFSGSIRDNIAVAKADASFDDIIRAARLAGAEEFIDRLPRGYDTLVYEGSPNLSGGQKQRLAIARALIVDPPILVLDEATSSLDAESESIINANISRIARGRTVIIISHRLSSIIKADTILVLDGGTINDSGTHNELLERNDIYSALWHQQNSHIAVAVGKANSHMRM